MAIIVQKYGGSSLATIEKIRGVARRVVDTAAAGKQVVVVVSARGRTTDELLGEARALGGHWRSRESDQLVSTGEVVSAATTALALRELGQPAVSMTGGQAGIQVSGEFGSAAVHSVTPDRLRTSREEGKVVVVAGFQGVDASGDVRTLGRGGSDTTAVALAAALGATCEIYTDVDGVYTADPRLVPRARLLPTVPAPLMHEMAHTGAGILHPRAVDLAATRRIPVQVRNSLGTNPGTVVEVVPGNPLESDGVVAAVTQDEDTTLVMMRGRGEPLDSWAALARMASAKVAPADLFALADSTHGSTLGFTSSPARQIDLAHIARQAGGTVELRDDLGRLSLVGTRMNLCGAVIETLAEILSTHGIRSPWIAISERRISILVPRGGMRRLALTIHDALVLGRGLEAHSSDR